MAKEEKKEEISGKIPIKTWINFLQEHPPGGFAEVLDAVEVQKTASRTNYQLIAPEIKLHCPESTCNAPMFFESEDGYDNLYKSEWTNTYLTYWCRNCRRYSKVFSVKVRLTEENSCVAFKFGEHPSFGPPVPPRVLRLIQPDRELFLKGRRCENQGLGIGAFTYYRRVVENQWTRMVDDIIKVAKVKAIKQERIEMLEAARNETRFSKAVKSLKDAIPPILLINDQNPLTLLHSALSIGVHDLPDDECLTLATSIRVVLIELAEKLSLALKDEKELKSAVSRLQKAKGEKKKKLGD